RTIRHSIIPSWATDHTYEPVESLDLRRHAGACLGPGAVGEPAVERPDREALHHGPAVVAHRALSAARPRMRRRSARAEPNSCSALSPDMTAGGRQPACVLSSTQNSISTP